MSQISRWRLIGFALAVLLGAPSPGRAQNITLNANPGPPNNGGSTGWGIFFDLSSPNNAPVIIEQMQTASTAAANATYSIEVFTRMGTALGGPVGQGPGSSPVGWTSLGTVTATQGPTAAGVSLPIDIPNIPLLPGQITGVAVVFTGAGPRYFGTGSPPYGTYSDTNLTLVTGDARSIPFTPTGSWFASRDLVGTIIYSLFPVELMGFEVQ
jgi:hypothetical protein